MSENEEGEEEMTENHQKDGTDYGKKSIMKSPAKT
jgi:hypothetical protein